MNDNQAFALGAGAVLEILVLISLLTVTSINSIFEIAELTLIDYITHCHTFLFAWPGASIDVGRLLCFFLLILVLTGWVVVGLRDKPARQTGTS